MNAIYPALVTTLSSQVLVSLTSLVGPVLAPIVAPELGLPEHLIGYYYGLIYILAAASSLVSGGFIARYGALRVSQACLVLCGLAMALTALAHPAFLLLAAVTMGIAYGPSTPSSSQILAAVAPPRLLNLVFSVKQTGVPLGNMLAGAVLPTLALTIGWRSSVLTVAAAALLLTLAIEPARARLDSARDPARSLWRGGVLKPLRVVLTIPPLRLLAVTSLAFAAMQGCVSAFLVIYLTSVIGQSLVAAGFLLSTAQVAGVAGRIVWAAVADRGGKPMRLLGVLGLAMSIAAVVAGLFTPLWPWLAIAAVSFVLGGTAIAWNGVFLAQVAYYAPAGRAGEITGATTALTFTGATLGPSVFAFVLSVSQSYALGFWIVAAVTLASGLWYLVGQYDELGGEV